MKSFTHPSYFQPATLPEALLELHEALIQSGGGAECETYTGIKKRGKAEPVVFL